MPASSSTARSRVFSGLSSLGTAPVSELLTNAIESTWEHRRHDPVRLWVLITGSGVLFLVWDATVRPPMLAAPAPGYGHGHGLTLVNDLCEQ